MLLISPCILLLTMLVPALPREDPHSAFGEGVCGVGDLNDDGFGDFLVADPGWAVFGHTYSKLDERGRVWALSGKDGATLWSVESDHLDDGFGCGLSRYGDVNGDGVPDCLVGTKDLRPEGLGFVYVLCGKTGEVLRTFHGTRVTDGFGLTLEGLGDVDGDGVPDFAVGSLGVETDDGPAGGSRIELLSGKSGKLLYASLCWISGFYGPDRPALRLGDVNGDGHTDFALYGGKGKSRAPFEVISGLDFSVIWKSVSAEDTLRPQSSIDWNGDGLLDVVAIAVGGVEVRAGDDGRRLAKIDAGCFGSSGYGQPILAIPDIDGDEIPELLIPKHTEGINWGCVRLRSGKDGQLIFATEPNGAWHFGLFLDTVDDVDGDGVPDFIVGGEHLVSRDRGKCWVHSGATGRELAVYVRQGDEVIHQARGR